MSNFLNRFILQCSCNSCIVITPTSVGNDSNPMGDVERLPIFNPLTIEFVGFKHRTIKLICNNCRNEVTIRL